MKVRVGFGLGVTAARDLGAKGFWEIVDACESLGWDSVWFSERATADVPDPLTAMAATTGRTRRLKFGTSVLVLPGRNPVLLAKQLATIDNLSMGRLIPAFGLGGDTPEEQEAFGVSRSEAAARVEEAVLLMKKLWSETNVTFEGRYFSVRDVTVAPRPAQTPHPDVWFGGRSKAALRRVGRLGEGWLPSFITASEYKPKADLIRTIADEAGREIDEEHYGALVPYLPQDAVAAKDAVLAAISARRPDVDPAEIVSVGGFSELMERLGEFVDQGASKFVVVPVVAPSNWPAELSELRDRVATPAENDA